MSVPVEHKPTGLVSGSQCPRERSPSAETKRGWLRCHLHHKGKPSLPEPLPARRATHHIYQLLCTHVIYAFCFFCPSLSPPLPFFLSGPHRLSTTNHINSRIPSPSVELSWNWLLSLPQPFSVSCAFSLVCIIFPRYKEPLTHLLLFFFSPLALAGKLYLGSANRQTYQTKSPVSRCQTLTCLLVSLGQRELPSWGAASEQTCFIWLVY